LQRLKAAELILRQFTPRLHAVIRRIYDRIGPVLARRMKHPVIADVAYLTFKPFEWSAWIAICVLLPRAARSSLPYSTNK
jgi:hypothetical protein